MTQPALPFDDRIPGRRPSRARRSDPWQSHDAADRMEESGAITRHCAIVLGLVIAHPGLSAKQLAEVAGCPLDYVQIDRRTSELELGGWIRRDRGGDASGRWLWPARKGRKRERAIRAFFRWLGLTAC